MGSQTACAEADPRIGACVGGYEIDSLLGAGGMGNVYAATAPDGSRVALKLVKEQYARDETFLRRFEREISIARTVRHPNLVPVLDSGEQDGLPYLAEQLIDGTSLDQRLARDHRLDLPTVVQICADVAGALDALWAAGMVHRDIKPANILLDAAGTACVTDFGLAKNTQGSVLTLPGQTVGSLNYMAPEQIRGDEVTTAADIYSLGCVVFECVQGRPPFGDRQGLRVLWAQLQEEPPDPCLGRDDVPPEFVRALKAALAKAPEERPSSAGEYAESLRWGAGLVPAVARRAG